MEPLDVALGMDLHENSAVCQAVYAGDGEPPEWLWTLLDDLDKNHRPNGAELQDMNMIVQVLKGFNVHALIENSTKIFDIYWVLTNLECHVTVA